MMKWNIMKWKLMNQKKELFKSPPPEIARLVDKPTDPFVSLQPLPKK